MILDSLEQYICSIDDEYAWVNMWVGDYDYAMNEIDIWYMTFKWFYELLSWISLEWYVDSNSMDGWLSGVVLGCQKIRFLWPKHLFSKKFVILKIQRDMPLCF